MLTLEYSKRGYRRCAATDRHRRVLLGSWLWGLGALTLLAAGCGAYDDSEDSRATLTSAEVAAVLKAVNGGDVCSQCANRQFELSHAYCSMVFSQGGEPCTVNLDLWGPISGNVSPLKLVLGVEEWSSRIQIQDSKGTIRRCRIVSAAQGAVVFDCPGASGTRAALATVNVSCTCNDAT